MTTPLVSIIIPCFNAERWIADTVESALAQTWSPTEIIVVDDGSTDHSSTIANRYHARGVRVIEQPNRGASAARNVGLELAHGALIQFIDADDLLAPRKIELQVRHLASSPVGAISRGPWTRFYDQPAAKPQNEATCAHDMTPGELLQIKAAPQILVPSCSWLCPRSVLDRAGLWDESLSLNDDGEYFARVIASASHVAWCENAFVHYRRHASGNLSGRNDRRAIESLYRSFALTERCILGYEDSPRMHLALAEMWSWLCYHLYPMHEDFSARAAAHATRFGLLQIPAFGGRYVRLLRPVLGWRFCRRLQFAKVSRRPSALWQ